MTTGTSVAQEYAGRGFQDVLSPPRKVGLCEVMRRRIRSP